MRGSAKPKSDLCNYYFVKNSNLMCVCADTWISILLNVIFRYYECGLRGAVFTPTYIRLVNLYILCTIIVS